jgi:urease accessory protein
MDAHPDWLLWQLADSAFPVGAFSHSGGLEAAWQAGEIGSRDDLAGFIESSLAQSAHGAVPFLKAAHTEPHRLTELDHWCDAFLTNHVANRASRQQGQALLLACERCFGFGALVELRARILAENLPGHLAPCFGTATRLLELNAAVAIRVFLFLQLRGLVAGAVRLGMIGPLQAQALQHRLSPSAEAAAVCGSTVELEEVAQTAPILDLLQGVQDRLYSRLYQS